MQALRHLRNAGEEWLNVKAEIGERGLNIADWCKANMPISRQWLDRHAELYKHWRDFLDARKWAAETGYLSSRQSGLEYALELIEARARSEPRPRESTLAAGPGSGTTSGTFSDYVLDRRCTDRAEDTTFSVPQRMCDQSAVFWWRENLWSREPDRPRERSREVYCEANRCFRRGASHAHRGWCALAHCWRHHNTKKLAPDAGTARVELARKWLDNSQRGDLGQRHRPPRVGARSSNTQPRDHLPPEQVTLVLLQRARDKGATDIETACATKQATSRGNPTRNRGRSTPRLGRLRWEECAIESPQTRSKSASVLVGSPRDVAGFVAHVVLISVALNHVPVVGSCRT